MKAQKLILVALLSLLLLPIIQASHAPTFTKLGNLADVVSTGTGVRSIGFNPVSNHVLFGQSSNVGWYSYSGTTFTLLSDPATLPAGFVHDIWWNSSGDYAAIGMGTTPFLRTYLRSGDTLTSVSDPATPPTSAALGVAINAQGTRFCAALSSTPYIAIYNWTGGYGAKQTNPSTLPTGQAQECAWSPDGGYVAIAHASSPYLTVYSVPAAGVWPWTPTKLSDPSTLPAGDSTGLAWNPNGTLLAIATQTSVYLYTVSGSTVTFHSSTSPSIGSVSDVGWTPDGQILTVNGPNTPFLKNYEWNASASSFNAALSNPSGLPAGGTPYNLNWSRNGSLMALGHATTPYLTIYDVYPPSTPVYSPTAATGFRVWNESATFNLSWSYSGDGNPVNGYNITRYPPSGSPVSYAIGNVTSWRDSNVTQGKTYNYSVYPWNQYGNGSGIIDTRNGTTSPPNFTATPYVGGVNLSWSTVTNGPWAFQGYNVYRDLSRIATNVQTLYYNDSYFPGGIYYITWNASNTEGPITSLLLANGLPSNESVTLDGRSWRATSELHWNASSLPGLIGYRINKGNSTSNETLLTTTGVLIRDYVDTPILPGECWWYSITPYNSTLYAATSNHLYLCYRPPPPALFGEHGSIYGGTVDENGTAVGGQAELATAMGTNSNSLGILWGFIMVCITAGGAYGATRTVPGAIVGLLIGVALAFIMQLFPVWLLAFIGVIATAVILYLYRRNQDGS